MKKIAFIGTGVMGKSIVKHLLAKQYEVSIYTRTKEKAQELLTIGALWAPTPKAAAHDADVIFTMVGYPQDVAQVVLGDEGVLQGAKEGAIIVEMTTSEPTLAKQLYKEAKQQGVAVLDAPVSGGDLGAQNGTLSIMIGGDEAVFNQVQPLLAVFCSTIVYQGMAGAGQHAKMCNQIAIASNMIGVCEAISYAERAGLTIDTVLASISTGAAGSWSLSHLAPRMAQKDYEPGFYIKHMVKDLGIALQEAKQMNLTLPGLEMANEMYQKLVAQGYGDNGTQALIRLYEV
ncbi:3-hydroxyisobutyrate dehydrogenase [Lysinibacillus alkalisoli]|uniref:3-hydroxyisobutyrate dehydrogenase n=2 Tax=Lysinibacillus alkalisoli TaxID=1911548 RepID=A0A917G326_9BACI|nr:3-hydroxyisobutyrate dehydrogenase [Lysinibacillus alkalisoli]